MAKNLILGLILVRFTHIWSPKISLVGLPLVDVIHCCILSLYGISREINEILTHLAQILFYKNLALSFIRYHGQISEKN